MKVQIQLYLALILEFLLAIVAMARIKRVLKVYVPFLVICIISFLAEAVNNIMVVVFRNNLPAANIYVLLELAFLLWQFHLWKVIPKSIVAICLGIGLIVWCVEVFAYTSIWGFAGIYRMVYAFIIVVLAVWQMNSVFVNEKKALIKNSMFLLCSGFVFYYALKSTVELLYKIQVSFIDYVWDVLSYSNMIVVIIYIMAVLRMPTRKAFSLDVYSKG